MTDRAIASILSGSTVVRINQVFIDTHSTRMTMQKVFSTTNATKTAIFAMIRTFVILHPQIAYITVIIPELRIAPNTRICFTALARKTYATNNFSNRESIYIVVGVIWIHGNIRTWKGGTSMDLSSTRSTHYLRWTTLHAKLICFGRKRKVSVRSFSQNRSNIKTKSK